jgi:hypothetical protein
LAPKLRKFPLDGALSREYKYSCKRIRGQSPAEERLMMTTSNRISGGFVAKWEGTCGKCAQPIHIGDRITQNGAGRPAVGYYGSKRYAHVSCGIVREAVAVVAAASIEQEKAEEAKQVSPVIATLVNDWIGVVQKTRALVSQIGAKIVVSPRASIKGAQLLRAGIAPKFIVEAIFGRYRAETAWTQVGIHAEEFARRSGLIETDRKWIKAAAKAGTQHKAFKSLVMLAMALNGEDKNIWLAGPAGSGKTTAARKLADALDLGERFDFNGAIDTEYKLSGFVDAKGRVVSTAFRKIWENGGVYLFDECDASMPGALLAFNAALANGVAAFPDGSIKRHPETVIIAAANTWGFGGDANYIGRAKLDAAFLDRFVTLAWGYDEDLERTIALG